MLKINEAIIINLKDTSLVLVDNNKNNSTNKIIASVNIFSIIRTPDSKEELKTMI